MSDHFTHRIQGEAEDVLLRHRFCYYVLHSPIVSDAVYDEMEREYGTRWSVGLCDVGSDNADSYPEYIREGVRPLAGERTLRDRGIAERWMRHLDRFAP